MPYHVRGHKPIPPRKKLVFSVWYRLLLASLGAGLVWCGSYPRNPANFMYLNWRRQPFYPNSVVPIGIVLIVVSAIPTSWIDRAVRRLAR